jgi:hypothetical protein
MYDDSNPFHFSVLPIDPMDPPTPPSAETQEEAFTDVAVQLITNLTIVAKDTSDPWRAIRILGHCQGMLDAYIRAGFNLLIAFQHDLKADPVGALREARRAFLAYGFKCPRSEYPEFLRILKATGWRTDDREAQEDYDEVVADLFDDDGCRRRPPDRSVARADG